MPAGEVVTWNATLETPPPLPVAGSVAVVPALGAAEPPAGGLVPAPVAGDPAAAIGDEARPAVACELPLLGALLLPATGAELTTGCVTDGLVLEELETGTAASEPALAPVAVGAALLPAAAGLVTFGEVAVLVVCQVPIGVPLP